MIVARQIRKKGERRGGLCPTSLCTSLVGTAVICSLLHGYLDVAAAADALLFPPTVPLFLWVHFVSLSEAPFRD